MFYKSWFGLRKKTKTRKFHIVCVADVFEINDLHISAF